MSSNERKMKLMTSSLHLSPTHTNAHQHGMMNQQMQWCETYLVITSLLFSHTAIKNTADNIDAVVAIVHGYDDDAISVTNSTERLFQYREKCVTRTRTSIPHGGLDILLQRQQQQQQNAHKCQERSRHALGTLSMKRIVT